MINSDEHCSCCVYCCASIITADVTFICFAADLIVPAPCFYVICVLYLSV